MSLAYVSEENTKIFKPTSLNRKEQELTTASNNPLASPFVNTKREERQQERINPKKPTPACDIPLDPQEQLFLDTITDLNNPVSLTDAATIAYPEILNPQAKSKRLMLKPNVKKSLERRQEINSYVVPYAEDDIIKAMWTEATREGKGSSHSARITALVQLGRHIGMFDTGGLRGKNTDNSPSSPVFNIINYNTTTPTPSSIAEKVVSENITEDDIASSDDIIDQIHITKF